MIFGNKDSGIRTPISIKIFGIALGLLLLMSFVTYVSTLNQEHVKDELEILTRYYIPLDQKMGEVRVYTLGQVLLFERLAKSGAIKTMDDAPAVAEAMYKEMGSCESSKIRETFPTIKKRYPAPSDMLQVQYHLVRACAEGEIKASDVLVREALTAPFIRTDVAHIGKFTELGKEMKDIPRSRDTFNKTVLKYIEEVNVGNSRSIELLEGQIDSNRAEINRQIRDVTDRIHQFTNESAARAKELEQRTLILGWSVTAGAIVLGLLFAAFITRTLVQPVRRLLLGTKAIEDGNLDIQVRVSTADEIALLTESFNRMVTGLKQKEVIRETFGKYIDPRVVKGLLGDQELVHSGEKKLMTVFFSDLQGFTALCEQLSPDGVVKFLNHYFTTMSAPIRDNKGIIDKYMGDAIMAFWGPPFSSETEHATLACFAALEQRARFNAFRQTLPDVLGFRKGIPEINIRMGIATGDVTVGSIGSDFTKSYTVVGDTVNLASRLEAANKQYGTHLIISEDTWQLANSAIETRELDCIRVLGKSEAVRVFELLGRKGQIDVATSELRDNFEKALMHYRKGEWERAEASFTACLSINSQDGPSNLFITRLKQLKSNPPVDQWSGVWELTQK